MRIDYTLYLVADFEFAGGGNLAGRIDQAVRGGVTAVQLRAKNLSSREFLELGAEIRLRLERRGIPLIVNDRVDIALACGAAGVHLGQDDMPLPSARRMLGKRKIIGLSVNTIRQAREAERLGADYVGLGPVFPTATKATDLPALGPGGIRRVKRAIGIPVVAIGGISKANARGVIDAGADGIAVVSAVLGAPDARKAARDLREAMEK